MQTRTHSLLESLANIAIGYAVALLSQLLIFPWYGIQIPIQHNLAIGAWFTGISLIRSYALRRWFTRRTEGNSTPPVGAGFSPRQNPQGIVTSEGAQ